MKRVRLAASGAMAWALAGLLSGCMSSDPCGRPGLFSRIGCRPRCCGMNCQGPAMAPGLPVSMGPVMGGVPFTGATMGPGCCDGALPPAESMYAGPILDGGPDAYGGPLIPGKMGMPFMPSPGMTPMPPAGNAIPAPPPSLPAPMPEPGNALRLTPVPGNSYAPRTPAGPSSRKGF